MVLKEKRSELILNIKRCTPTFFESFCFQNNILIFDEDDALSLRKLLKI